MIHYIKGTLISLRGSTQKSVRRLYISSRLTIYPLRTYYQMEWVVGKTSEVCALSTNMRLMEFSRSLISLTSSQSNAKIFRHSKHDDVRRFVAYVKEFDYLFVKNSCCSWILFQQQRVSNHTQIPWQPHRPIIYMNGHGLQKQLHCNRVAPTYKNNRQF